MAMGSGKKKGGVADGERGTGKSTNTSMLTWRK